MKTFLMFYLVMVLINVLITAVMYVKKPGYFAGCSFSLVVNLVTFFLWPVVWIQVIIEHISRNG